MIGLVEIDSGMALPCLMSRSISQSIIIHFSGQIDTPMDTTPLARPATDAAISILKEHGRHGGQRLAWKTQRGGMLVDVWASLIFLTTEWSLNLMLLSLQ